MTSISAGGSSALLSGGGEKFCSENRGRGPRTKPGAATCGWTGIGVRMQNNLAAIANRTARLASASRPAGAPLPCAVEEWLLRWLNAKCCTQTESVVIKRRPAGPTNRRARSLAVMAVSTSCCRKKEADSRLGLIDSRCSSLGPRLGQFVSSHGRLEAPTLPIAIAPIQGPGFVQ
jgi:hypothetical protein